MDAGSAQSVKALVGLAIERALFKKGKSAFDKVEDLLQKKYQCSIMDSYEHPIYLKKVLEEAFGISHMEVTNIIVKFLEDFGEEASIEGFLKKMGG